MTNYCDEANSDPARRNSWGVDLNRNFSVGSAFDGFSGAGTTSSTSATFAGPGELTEPEAKNEVWLASTYPNIKLAMNTYPYGGYFMWPPGACKADGRVLLPQVDLGTENHRRDFEVGADIYNSTTGRFSPVGFQPNFAEGHQEAMEFANGQIGILEVALAHENDRMVPKAHLKVTEQQPGSTTFTFTTNEPATVYYTIDGSRPTFDSPKLTAAGLREGAGSVTVNSTTEVKWFSVDIAGKVESRYRPDTKAQSFQHEVVKVKK